jgi:cell division protein FtsB
VGLKYEIRKRARHAIAPVLFLCFAAYLAYHTVNGERGLIAWAHMTQQLAQVNGALSLARVERDRLERRVMLLRPDSLDPDMLEERARAVLNYGLPNERVYVEPRAAEDR